MVIKRSYDSDRCWIYHICICRGLSQQRPTREHIHASLLVRLRKKNNGKKEHTADPGIRIHMRLFHETKRQGSHSTLVAHTEKIKNLRVACRALLCRSLQLGCQSTFILIPTSPIGQAIYIYIYVRIHTYIYLGAWQGVSGLR